MESSLHKTVALRWIFFCLFSSIIAFEEYSPLYLQQLGFSASQIGLTTVMGLPLLFLPFLGLLSDKFRARKLALATYIVLLTSLFFAPLATYVLDALQPTCIVNPNHRFIVSNETDPHLKSNFLLENSFTTTKNGSFQSPNFSVAVSKSAGNFNKTSSNAFKGKAKISWSPKLFLYMTFIKGSYGILSRTIISLCNVAVLTHLTEERAHYGSYFCWGQFGGSISLFAVGFLASQLTTTLICGSIGNSYFLAFIWATVAMSLSLIAVPWITYEYFENRVINWTDVKKIAFEKHYLIMLFICFYSGSCFSFQLYWEFWFIAGLSGDPIIMAISGLIRRPFVALWPYLSGKVIERLGDLQTIVLALFAFAISFLTLSFIQNPWLVIGVDVFQSSAFAFSYSALTVHFSKAASKASSGTIQALPDMAFALGQESGATIMGLLFSCIGTRSTLFYYAIATTILLQFFIMYIIKSKRLHEYEKVSESDEQ